MASTLRSTLGAVRRSARRLRDRTLHPLRRRRALRRVREELPPRRVLVLCLGNICRSPYAELYLRQHSGDLGLEVESAGFIGPDRSSPDEAQAVAAERGIDLSPHRSKLVTREMARRADVVLLVDPVHGRRLLDVTGGVRHPTLVLGDFDPVTPDRRVIADPWGEEAERFRGVYARLDRCLGVLLEEWRARL